MNNKNLNNVIKIRNMMLSIHTIKEECNIGINKCRNNISNNKENIMHLDQVNKGIFNKIKCNNNIILGIKERVNDILTLL